MSKISYNAGAATVGSGATPCRASGVPSGSYSQSVGYVSANGPARAGSQTIGPAASTYASAAGPARSIVSDTKVSGPARGSYTMPRSATTQNSTAPTAGQTSGASTTGYTPTNSASTASYGLATSTFAQSAAQSNGASTASYTLPTSSVAQLSAQASGASTASYSLSSGGIAQPVAQSTSPSEGSYTVSSGAIARSAVQSSSARTAPTTMPTCNVARSVAPTDGAPEVSSVAKTISTSTVAYASQGSVVDQAAADPPIAYARVIGTGSIAQTANQALIQQNMAAPAVLGRPLSAPATCNPLVEYYSASKQRWILGSFEGFNTEFGTYTLNVQPYARAGDVRYAPEASVEYYSNSCGRWIPAVVNCFDEDLDVYALDVQPYAKPQDVRLAGFEEPLQEPCMENRRDPDWRIKMAAATAPVVTEMPAPAPQLQEVQVMPAEEEDDPMIAELVNSLTASDRFPVGARVEYFDKKGTWLPAKVMGFDETLGTYQLDIQPYALAGHVRLPGTHLHLPDAPGAAGLAAEAPNIEKDGEGGEDVKPEPKGSVPQFTVQKQREGDRVVFVVFLEGNDGKQIRAFDGECTNFELGCEADPLRTWLDGVSNDMLPGLLTLLQYEVSFRNERLQAMQEEKDSYSGVDAYEYFGLDEEATDQEIARAYRQKAKELHPDKGGDEEDFEDMRKRYDQLKANRAEGGQGGKKAKGGEGDPLSWDPCDRASMLNAHDKMRSFLVWVSNDAAQISKDLEELRRRHVESAAARRTLLDEGQVAAAAAPEACPTTSAAPVAHAP